MRRFLIQISVSYRWLYPNHALEVKRLTIMKQDLKTYRTLLHEWKEIWLFVLSNDNKISYVRKQKKSRHKEKLDSLKIIKCINEEIHKSPNTFVQNLSDIGLSDNEITTLKFGLKHGILTRLKETKKAAVMEDIYGQIVWLDLLKKDNIC